MEKGQFGGEEIPIAPPLKIVNFRTLSKGFGWWAAVALIESWGSKQICLYLWQKKGNVWKRKQKFTIHDREQWELIVNSVEDLLKELK